MPSVESRTTSDDVVNSDDVVFGNNGRGFKSGLLLDTFCVGGRASFGKLCGAALLWKDLCGKLSRAASVWRLFSGRSCFEISLRGIVFEGFAVGGVSLERCVRESLLGVLV